MINDIIRLTPVEHKVLAGVMIFFCVMSCLAGAWIGSQKENDLTDS